MERERAFDAFGSLSREERIPKPDDFLPKKLAITRTSVSSRPADYAGKA
jgi:hypothetical protein